MKPEPKIDENGVPWCTVRCPAKLDRLGGSYCAISGNATAPALWMCSPAISDLAASEKRHREAWEWLAEGHRWLQPEYQKCNFIGLSVRRWDGSAYSENGIILIRWTPLGAVEAARKVQP